MTAPDLTTKGCIFCEATGPFSIRPYDPRTPPAGVTWPSGHCFLGKTIAICAACGGGFVRELMEDDELGAFYSALYVSRRAIPAPKAHDLHELHPRFFSQALYLKSWINLFDGMRILEVGPNIVSALPALSLFCKPQYSYFDQVESPIIANYGGRYLGPYASGNQISAKLGTGCLDLVYTSHSLEHVNPSALDELLRAISAAVVPGGYFFAEVPDDLRADHLVMPHVLFFSETSLVRLLERYGFDAVSVGRWGSGHQSGDPHRPDFATGVYGRTSVAVQTRTRNLLRRIIQATPLSRVIKPLRLMRALRQALRALPTPYDSRPFLRIIAQKR